MTDPEALRMTSGWWREHPAYEPIQSALHGCNNRPHLAFKILTGLRASGWEIVRADTTDPEVLKGDRPQEGHGDDQGEPETEPGGAGCSWTGSCGASGDAGRCHICKVPPADEHNPV